MSLLRLLLVALVIVWLVSFIGLHVTTPLIHVVLLLVLVGVVYDLATGRSRL